MDKHILYVSSPPGVIIRRIQDLFGTYIPFHYFDGEDPRSSPYMAIRRIVIAKKHGFRDYFPIDNNHNSMNCCIHVYESVDLPVDLALPKPCRIHSSERYGLVLDTETDDDEMISPIISSQTVPEANSPNAQQIPDLNTQEFQEVIKDILEGPLQSIM